VYASTRCHFSARNQPAAMNAAFHTAVPAVVRARNFGSGIRIMPAGNETTLRSTGTHRAAATIQLPYLSKSVQPRSTSFCEAMKNHGRPASRCSRS